MDTSDYHQKMKQDQLIQDRKDYVGMSFELYNLHQYRIHRQVYRGIPIWYNDVLIFGSTKFPFLNVKIIDLFADPKTQIAVFKCNVEKVDPLLVVKRFKGNPESRHDIHFDIQKNFLAADWKYITKAIGEFISIPKHDFTGCFKKI